MKVNHYQAVVQPHRKYDFLWGMFAKNKPLWGSKNKPLWEAIKFLLFLLLILLIATPQLVIAVLLLLLIGAVMEAIKYLAERKRK